MTFQLISIFQGSRTKENKFSTMINRREMTRIRSSEDRNISICERKMTSQNTEQRSLHQKARNSEKGVLKRRQQKQPLRNHLPQIRIEDGRKAPHGVAVSLFPEGRRQAFNRRREQCLAAAWRRWGGGGDVLRREGVGAEWGGRALSES